MLGTSGNNAANGKIERTPLLLDVEEQPSIADHMESFLDGKVMAIITMLLTLYTLFGDDLRIFLFDKPSDIYFQVLFTVSFAIFGLEIILMCILKNDYKNSFFFWLDIISTASLLFDIDWFSSFMGGSSGDSQFQDAGRASRAGSRASRIVRLTRLIRLVRIMKLYKMLKNIDKSDEEKKLHEDALAATNAKQAALQRMEASRLGKQLNDVMTRIVIVGVLIMLVGLPILQPSGSTDNSKYWGLKQIFILGLNKCEDVVLNVETQCVSSANAEYSWKWAIFNYAQLFDSEVVNQLLWLHVPNYFLAGDMSTIDHLEETMYGATYVWESDPLCGINYDDSCKWRRDELKLIEYVQNNVKAYAQFEVKQDKRSEALLGLLLTLFTIVLLGTLIYLFSRDTHKLVIAPIEKMVNIVKQLADDPLRKNLDIQSITQGDAKAVDEPKLETSMLENTIIKIGGLLQVGFGEAGADIIGKNMSTGDGELNIMIPGQIINAIFGFCDIRRFTDVTECLKESVMIFLNTVGEILHHCCHRWNGAPNKNVGDAFLFTWKYIDDNTGLASGRTLQASQGANKALVAFLKAIVEIRRSPELIRIESDHRIIKRFGNNYKLKIGYALHVGWAIEGAIGSDYKIDASYLSPHVNFTERLQEATKYYKTHLVMSEPFYLLLSCRAKARIRKIDQVVTRICKESVIGVYCYDMNESIPPAHHKASREWGSLTKPPSIDELPEEHLLGSGVEYVFEVDADIIALRDDLSQDLIQIFQQGLMYYISGNWPKAQSSFAQCLQIQPNDGPSHALREYILQHKCIPPEDWKGARKTVPYA